MMAAARARHKDLAKFTTAPPITPSPTALPVSLPVRKRK